MAKQIRTLSREAGFEADIPKLWIVNSVSHSNIPIFCGPLFMEILGQEMLEHELGASWLLLPFQSVLAICSLIKLSNVEGRGS